MLYRSPTVTTLTDRYGQSDMQVGHIRLEVYCRNYASLTQPRPNTVHPATYHSTSGLVGFTVLIKCGQVKLIWGNIRRHKVSSFAYSITGLSSRSVLMRGTQQIVTVPRARRRAQVIQITS